MINLEDGIRSWLVDHLPVFAAGGQADEGHDQERLDQQHRPVRVRSQS